MARMRTRAGKARPEAPRLAESDQARYPALYTLAALAWLQGSGATALTPAQSAQLLPFVQAWADRMQAQAAFYPKVAALLRPEQLEGMVANLERMRQDEGLAHEQAVTLAELAAFLAGREAP